MRALLIHNPSAGMRTDYSALQSALVVMREAGWEVEARETQAGGDAINLARQAAQSDYGAVFAVGGDGTLNEVMNGVLGSDTALGVLPYGTANVWAKEMGLPLNDMAAAARVQVYAPVMVWSRIRCPYYGRDRTAAGAQAATRGTHVLARRHPGSIHISRKACSS